jgi:hypothetical protein
MAIVLVRLDIGRIWPERSRCEGRGFSSLCILLDQMRRRVQKEESPCSTTSVEHSTAQSGDSLVVTTECCCLSKRANHQNCARLDKSMVLRLSEQKQEYHSESKKELACSAVTLP